MPLGKIERDLYTEVGLGDLIGWFGFEIDGRMKRGSSDMNNYTNITG